MEEENIVNKIKKAVKDAKRSIKTYETKTKWSEIPNYNENAPHIHLYEGLNEKGSYLLKARAIIKNCDPEKILKLNTDNNYETRKQWEIGGELMNIEQLERYEKEKTNIIRYHINIPVPMIYDREFLGVQWWDYNEKHKMHRLVHKTFNYDEKFPCDTNKFVQGECQSILLIKAYGTNAQLVTIYSFVNPLGWIPESILPLWKEKLRERMLLYETLSKSDRFDEIYNIWECENCQATLRVKPDENRCRKCRYVNKIVDL